MLMGEGLSTPSSPSLGTETSPVLPQVHRCAYSKRVSFTSPDVNCHASRIICESTSMSAGESLCGEFELAVVNVNSPVRKKPKKPNAESSP